MICSLTLFTIVGYAGAVESPDEQTNGQSEVEHQEYRNEADQAGAEYIGLGILGEYKREMAAHGKRGEEESRAALPLSVQDVLEQLRPGTILKYGIVEEIVEFREYGSDFVLIKVRTRGDDDLVYWYNLKTGDKLCLPINAERLSIIEILSGNCILLLHHGLDGATPWKVSPYYVLCYRLRSGQNFRQSA